MKTSITLLGSPYTSVLGGVQFHHLVTFTSDKDRFFTPAVGRLEWVINPRARLGFFLLGGYTTSKWAKCSRTFRKCQELNLMIRNDSMMFPLLSEFGLRYQLLHQWSCVPFKKLLFNDSSEDTQNGQHILPNRGHPFPWFRLVWCRSFFVRRLALKAKSCDFFLGDCGAGWQCS